MRPLIARFSLVLSCFMLLSACVQFNSQRGVEVAWQTQVLQELRTGESSRADVLDLLGPPSQVIALEDETVLYYLFEKSAGEGMVLALYNKVDIKTRYDRAIFFFDKNDKLRDYSTRIYREDDS